MRRGLRAEGEGQRRCLAVFLDLRLPASYLRLGDFVLFLANDGCFGSAEERDAGFVVLGMLDESGGGGGEQLGRH